MYLDHRVSWCGDCFACSECGMKFTPTLSPHRQQSIQLNDWLAVLGGRLDESRWHLKSDGRVMWEDHGVNFEKLKFNLTTGQPATEADYKAFNQITSV